MKFGSVSKKDAVRAPHNFICGIIPSHLLFIPTTPSQQGEQQQDDEPQVEDNFPIDAEDLLDDDKDDDDDDDNVDIKDDSINDGDNKKDEPNTLNTESYQENIETTQPTTTEHEENWSDAVQDQENNSYQNQSTSKPTNPTHDLTKEVDLGDILGTLRSSIKKVAFFFKTVLTLRH